MEYEKYIQDGKVAVLYSPGFGAGWYTWNTEYEGLVFDKELVQALLKESNETVGEVASRKYKGACLGGVQDLEIYWVEQGLAFEIEEYDGSESVHVIGERDYLIA